jgi:ribosomal protein L11 methylase PrmA
MPTADDEVEVFFDLAPVGGEDVVYDLGSGDGRLLFAALERGAGRAVGIDLNEARVSEARQAAARRGLGDRAVFIHADIMETSLSEATVVLCYLYSTASAALKPKLAAELKPGTRVVMESFPVHGWRPVEVRHLPARTFYLYRMPPEPDPDV